MFDIAANLNGHGQTWNRAVEFQPIQEWLRISFRSQSPQPPKNIARTVCKMGNTLRNCIPWAMRRSPALLDTTMSVLRYSRRKSVLVNGHIAPYS